MPTVQMEAELLSKWQVLSEDKRIEVLEYVESLCEDTLIARKPYRSSLGIGKQYGTSISSDEIDQARKEMWGNFPRDDF